MSDTLYFHLIDREWGRVTIRICSYPPFGAQVILNGHERVEQVEQATLFLALISSLKRI
jgi:hypothetical protein